MTSPLRPPAPGPTPVDPHDWALAQPGVDGDLADSIRLNKLYGKLTLLQISRRLEKAEADNLDLRRACEEALALIPELSAWVEYDPGGKLLGRADALEARLRSLCAGGEQ